MNERPQITSILEILDVNTGNRETVKEFDYLIEAPNWTPDGQWLVYNSGGKLYKMSPDNPSEPELINTDYATNCNNDHLITADGKYIAISHSPAGQSSLIYVLPFVKEVCLVWSPSRVPAIFMALAPTISSFPIVPSVTAITMYM